MRVLITGAGGQLGRDLEAALGQGGHHEVVACDRSMLDVADRDSTLQAITTVAPDAIVHAAAWTEVDACEDDPDRAFAVNALGTRHVVEGARIVGATGCYLSTDYVFDGSSTRPYNEWDTPNPLSVYGRSKRGGELEVTSDWSVVRTSWVCGAHGSNFAKIMLRLAGERDTLRVVNDQHECPTFAPDLAEAIRRLVVARATGTYHVTNQGETTRFGFTRALFEAARLDPARVEPISSAEYPTKARRPAYAVLDNAALRLQGLPLLPPWQESLHRLVKELTA